MQPERGLRNGVYALSLLLAAGGCGEVDDFVLPGSPLSNSDPSPAGGTSGNEPAVLIDESGLRWERIGKATFVEPGDVAGPAQPAANFDPSTVSLEKLSEYMTPIMLVRGTEYRASREDAMKIALSIRQAASGPRIDSRDTEAVQRAQILETVDPRLNLNGRAAEFPFNQIATMRRPDSGIPGAYVCTCFKMLNPYTCVTAAHCLANDSSSKEKPRSWRPPGHIKFKAGATGWGNTGIIDHWDHSYTMVLPLGFWTSPGSHSKFFDYAVIRFRGSFLGSTDPTAGGDRAPQMCPSGGEGRRCSHPDSPDVPPALYDTGGANGFLPWINVADGARQRVAVAGYPGIVAPDRDLKCSQANATFPWPTLAYHEGLLLRPTPGDTRLSYGASACFGQSGGPVFALNQPWCTGATCGVTPPPTFVVGIHTHAENGINAGIRMTSHVVDWMNIVAGY